MMVRAAIAFAASVVAFAACTPPAPAPAPLTDAAVQVEGKPSDLRPLAGHWTGEFHNELTGHHGTITFSLQPGRDTAYARVVPDWPAPSAGCVDPVSTATRPAGQEEFVLRLGRVGVSEGSVGGWLTPYPDPSAGCLVETWFEGLLKGDLLEGFYSSHRADGGPLRQGTWWVRRSP